MFLFHSLTSLYLLLFQPGELPVPQKSKPNEEFGNFTFMDFVSDNWFYILAILFMVALILFYLREKKKEKEEEDRAKMN